MAVILTKGTKEYVPVTVVDDQAVLSSLTSPLYDVLKDDDSTLYSGASAVATGLIANCMIDISSGGPGGLIAEGTRLRLFLKFSNSPEAPRLGPIILKVTDEAI